MKYIFFFVLTIGFKFLVLGQDTFSIVAIDEETGEIGSAGATCLDDDNIAGGALIISDIVVGKGAIHTQSFWLPANQQNANQVLQEGNSAKGIIDFLIANDAENNPSVRQYGVVTFAGGEDEKSAAFTGDNCFDVKKHVVGETFAVQGNILLNENIVDAMVANYVNTNGPLHAKLMAAMQGANIPGADSRCLNEGVSSRSAFLRVAKPTDTNDNLWLDLLVSKTPFGIEPIDSLQVLYDNFILSTEVENKVNTEERINVFPNPSNGTFSIETGLKGSWELEVYDTKGRLVLQKSGSNNESTFDLSNQKSGVYLLYVKDKKRNTIKQQLIVQK